VRARDRGGQAEGRQARPAGAADSRHLAEPDGAGAERLGGPGVRRDHASEVARAADGVFDHLLHRRHAPADQRELRREGLPGSGRQVGHHQRGHYVGAHPAQDERREEDEHERRQRQGLR